VERELPNISAEKSVVAAKPQSLPPKGASRDDVIAQDEPG